MGDQILVAAVFKVSEVVFEVGLRGLRFGADGVGLVLDAVSPGPEFVDMRDLVQIEPD